MNLDFTQPFFAWAENSYLGLAISDGTYPFAIIEVFHLFGLTLLMGGVFVMSLRLFGAVMTDESVSEVSHGLRLWTGIGLATSLVSGICLFAAEGLKCFGSKPFWWKMAFLFVALIFHFTLWRKVTRSERNGKALQLATGILSICLWLGVGFFGRAIGYF